MRRRPLSLTPLAAGLLVAASGCASAAMPAGDGQAHPPADFLLAVECEGAFNPHCDWKVEVRGNGRVDYRLRHRGTRPADRRGTVVLDRDPLGDLWRAVLLADLPSLPPRLAPQEGQEERGIVTYSLAAPGRRATVVADRAANPALDHLLRTLFRVLPHAIWRVPGTPATPVP